MHVFVAANLVCWPAEGVALWEAHAISSTCLSHPSCWGIPRSRGLFNLNGLPCMNTIEFDVLPGRARSSAAGDCTRVSGVIGEYFSAVRLVLALDDSCKCRQNWTPDNIVSIHFYICTFIALDLGENGCSPSSFEWKSTAQLMNSVGTAKLIGCCAALCKRERLHETSLSVLPSATLGRWFTSASLKLLRWTWRFTSQEMQGPDPGHSGELCAF